VIKKESHIRMVWTERNVMAKLSDGHNNPFLLSLEHAFQNERELFFVMEFMQGGDLRFHLTKRGLMTEAECRFYAAEMVLALESMHRSSIIYRDFKPGQYRSNTAVARAGAGWERDCGCVRSRARDRLCWTDSSFFLPVLAHTSALSPALRR